MKTFSKYLNYKLKSKLKECSLIYKALRFVRYEIPKFSRSPYIPFSIINVIKTFPLYSPASAGSYGILSKLTIQSINETVPALIKLTSLSHNPHRLRKVEDVFDLSNLEEQIDLLRKCFLKWNC